MTNSEIRFYRQAVREGNLAASVQDLEEYCKVEKLGKEGSCRPVGFGG